MHKLIPFKKEIVFKNNIDEITSIAMEDKLEINNLTVQGDFIVEGEVVSNDKKENFHFQIPFSSYLDEDLDTVNAKVKVDDFYYEIQEPNVLILFMDVLIDNLSEKKLIEIVEPAINETKEDVINNIEERDFEILNTNYQEGYMTYKIYIVREGDTVESILEKYQITLDKLSKYNTINELNIGDKLIIPNEKNK